MRLLAVFLAIAALVLIPFLIWGGTMDAAFREGRAVSILENWGAWAWAAGVGLLVADLFIPAPSTVVMSALGLIYGWFLGGIIASAGSLLAALAGYGLSHALGERGARLLLGEHDLARGKAIFAGGAGGAIIAATRALPLLAEVAACLAGLAGMRFGRFALAAACGCLPLGFIFAAVGALGKDQPTWGIALSVAIPLALWFISRSAIKRHERARRKD